jgi:hypothetical protein
LDDVNAAEPDTYIVVPIVEGGMEIATSCSAEYLALASVVME